MNEPQNDKTITVYTPAMSPQDMQELRRYSLRKRLDYVGGIVGLLEGTARMPVEKAK